MRGLMANAIAMKNKQKRSAVRVDDRNPSDLSKISEDYETSLLEMQKEKQRKQREHLASKAMERRDAWLDSAKNNK